MSFSAQSTDSASLALTYTWNFGDSSSTTGQSVQHTYLSAGQYTVTVTATDALSASASNSVSVTVAAPASSSAGALTVDCNSATDTYCGATSATQYSGSGVGVWKYVNSTATDATLNFSINGVSSGKKVTLLYTNANASSISSIPSNGVSSTIVATPDVATLAQVNGATNTEAQAHAKIEQANQLFEQTLNRSVPVSARSSVMTAQKTIAAVAATPPSVGTSRTWYDSGDDTTNPVAYTAQVAATCTLPSGRNVVIWLDPNATTANLITSTDITAMTSAVCGTTGGFARLNALLGDVWGATSSSLSTVLIQDGSSLQDINIVLEDKATQTWCGYFLGLNNWTQTYASSQNSAYKSNEALVFFIDANCYKNSGANYTRSALFHEATHMTNYYQRAVLLSKSHESWLEETSAMMTEDIVSPAVLSYSSTKSPRVVNYLQSGGGVSYVNWTNLGTSSYGLGGAFGGFLNRRYGLKIYQQLISSSCNDHSYQSGSSYTCLDSLIKANGGTGFADEYARFGASVFTLMNGAQTASGYGYPAKTDSGYTMAALDLSTLSTYLKTTATSLGSTFPATSHTYLIDTIGSGVTTYTRTGVVVPANTSLTVIIK